MSNSISLLGIDSRYWSTTTDWLSRALEVISRERPSASAFRFQPVNPPAEYSGDIAADLGGVQKLQEFASSVGQFPHLSSMFGRPAYFLPIDFAKPLTRIPRTGLLGRLFGQRLFVGSSVALLQELNSLAPIAGLTQDAGELGMETVEEITEDGELPAERFSWAVLRWFARMSIEKSAIVEIG